MRKTESKEDAGGQGELGEVVLLVRVRQTTLLPRAWPKPNLDTRTRDEQAGRLADLAEEKEADRLQGNERVLKNRLLEAPDSSGFSSGESDGRGGEERAREWSWP